MSKPEHKISEEIGWDPENGYWWYLEEVEDGKSLKSSEHPLYFQDIRAASLILRHLEEQGVHFKIETVMRGSTFCWSMSVGRSSATSQNNLPEAISFCFLAHINEKKCLTAL